MGPPIETDHCWKQCKYLKTMEIVAMPYFPPKTTLQITSLKINLKKSHGSLGTQELRSPVLGKSGISGPTKVLGQYVGHGQVADSGRLIDRKCASQLLTDQDEQHNQRSHNNAPPHPDHPQKYAVSAQHNKMRLANTNLCTSMHLPRLKHIRLHQKKSRNHTSSHPVYHASVKNTIARIYADVGGEMLPFIL